MALRWNPPPLQASAGQATIIVSMLAAASVVELMILRVFTRTAIHIPALNTLQEPYRVVSAGGRYAYFVALGLVIPAVAVLAWELFRRRAPTRHLTAFGLLLFAIPCSLTWFGIAGVAVLDVGTIAGVVALGVAFALTARPLRQAFPVACFSASFVAGGLFTALPAIAAANGASISQPEWLLRGAEAGGLAFALSTPLLVRGSLDRLARWAGIVVAAVLILALLRDGSTLRFLLLWNVGLSGSMPGIAYAAAAGALAYSALALFRQGATLAAAGLLLLISGGLGLHSTYQSGLALAGLAALIVASAWSAQEVGHNRSDRP